MSRDIQQAAQSMVSDYGVDAAITAIINQCELVERRTAIQNGFTKLAEIYGASEVRLMMIGWKGKRT